MAAGERWFFSRDQLENSPSRKFGIDVDRELSYRQQAANLIQDMGQRLHVSQLCINTAIVYMHRFYVFHSFTQFHRNSMAAAALFLAAKVEEQPRKLEHVIKVAHLCLRTATDNVPVPDSKSEAYAELAAELVFNEDVLLQTLGFDVAIDHPHTHVVRCCHLVKASKDLAQTSYFLASNSLHLTTMCLQYKPTVVACFCIHLACKWSNWEIPNSSEGKDWFYYVDQTVTTDLLKELTQEFIQIYNKCPSRLKRKIMSMSASQGQSMPSPGGGPSSAPTGGHVNFPMATCNSPMTAEPKKMLTPPVEKKESSAPFHPKPHGSHGEPKPGPSGQYRSMSQQQQSSLHESQNPNYLEYKEKKERERLERERHHMKQPLLANPDVPPNRYSQMPPSSGHKHPSSQPSSRSHPHHHRSSSANVDPKYKMQQQASSNRDQTHYRSGEPLAKDARDPMREAARDFRESREQTTKDMRDSRHGREAPPVAGRDPTRDIIREVTVRNHSKEAPVNDTSHGIDHSEQSSDRDCNGEQQLREHYSNYQSNRDFSAKLIRHDDVLSNSNSELFNSEVSSNNRYDPNVRAKPNSNSNSAVNNPETNNSNKSIPHPNKQYASKQYPTQMSYNELLNTANKNKQNSQQSIDKNYLNKVPSNIPQQMHSSSGSQQKTKQPPYGIGTGVPSQDKNPVPICSVTPQNVNKKSELPSLLDDLQVKTESVDVESSSANRLQTPPPPVKVRSIFSPDKEKTPTPPKRSKQNKTPDVTQFPPGLGTVPPAVSPFGSPPFSSKNTPGSSKNRNRTYSSSSEPELIPVVKKLEDMSGFENIIRDSKMGIKLHKVPESTPPVQDDRAVVPKPTDAGRTKFLGAVKQEEPVTIVEQTVRSEPQTVAKQETAVIKKEPLVNGLEPSTLTDNTIKQSLPADVKSEDKQKLQPSEVETVIQPATETAVPTERKSEHHHKSEKKKKKEKHKHKDKERSREEKEKKKKHKDKDRERHRDKSSTEQAVSVAPLKIKLPKEKIAPLPQTDLPIPTGLKIKIPKERLKTDSITSTSSPGSGSGGSLKIKISKDKIENLCNAGADSSNKRKREAPSPQTGPPAKVPNYNRSSESRQNGRSSYNAKQVSLGEGGHAAGQWSVGGGGTTIPGAGGSVAATNNKSSYHGKHAPPQSNRHQQQQQSHNNA